MVTKDGVIARPPVTDYKLVDVPELGYFLTDKPHPRGELLVKSATAFPGYFKRPDVTANAFDPDGYYRTGDVMAELGPDRLAYVDRRNNVLKLAQGEFVAVARLEAVFASAALVRQIFVYGNSERPYLLAVVVPTDEALDKFTDDADGLKAALSESLRQTAKQAELQSYECPPTSWSRPSHSATTTACCRGSASCCGPSSKSTTAQRLEDLYAELAATRHGRTAHAARRGGGPTGDRHADPRRRVAAGPGRRPAATGRAVPRTRRRLAVRVDLLQPAAGHLRRGGAGRADHQPDDRICGSSPNTLRPNVNPAPSGRPSRPCTDAAPPRSVPPISPWTSSSTRQTLAAAPALPRVYRHAAHGPADRRQRLPGPVPGAGLARAVGRDRRQAHHASCAAPTTTPPTGAWRRSSTAGTRTCSSDSARWPPTTSRSSSATSASRILAWSKRLGIRWHRRVDLIVHPAALVNHVLPYDQLFGPNVVGTAELIRLAITSRIKPVTYLSTVAVAVSVEPGKFTEDGDIRDRQPGTSGRRQLRQRIRQQQVGRRGTAPRGARPVRSAGRGVPIRPDPRAQPVRGTAQRARYVHPVDIQPAGHRHRAVSRSTRPTLTETGRSRTTTVCPPTSWPNRSPRSASRWLLRQGLTGPST